MNDMQVWQDYHCRPLINIYVNVKMLTSCATYFNC